MPFSPSGIKKVAVIIIDVHSNISPMPMRLFDSEIVGEKVVCCTNFLHTFGHINPKLKHHRFCSAATSTFEFWHNGRP